MSKNIIFYFSDQQRADTICEDVTPFLCQLAAEGTQFSNAFTCQPVCGPARACLQTGVFASQNGCYINDRQLSPKANTIAKILDAQGYDTAYIGKWHLASHGPMKNYQTKPIPEELRGGYKYWRAADCLEFTSDGYGGYVYDNNGNKVTFDYNRADAINDLAMEYIDGRSGDKPFFMFVSQLEPHHQNSTDRYECPKGYGDRFRDKPYPGDIDGLKGNYESRYADYLGCCYSLDENVRRMVDKLREKGLWDNTVLIYASDHGCHFRTRNFEYKRSCHHGSCHIPMIAVGGEFDGGGRYDGLVSLIDIPATVLRLAGAEIPPEFEGIPLTDYLGGDKSRDFVYVEISESQLGRAIITREYTYSVRKPKSLGLESVSAKHYIEDKLYDNINDPYQRHNLICDNRYVDIRARLRRILSDEIYRVSGERPRITRKLTKWRSQP